MLPLVATAGVNDVANALETGVTANTLWGSISPFVPFIVGMILFAFGLVIVRRVIKGASRGKAKI